MPTNQIDHDPANGCPICGGRLWDNRDTKKNPKAPDFKCRDRSCEGVIWPPKGGARQAPAASTKQAFTSGPHIPALDGPTPIREPEYGDEPAQQAAVDRLHTQRRVAKLDEVLSLHDVCVDHALAVTRKKLLDAGIVVTAADVLAAAATQLIGVQRVTT